jgi:hypothetical protein
MASAPTVKRGSAEKEAIPILRVADVGAVAKEFDVRVVEQLWANEVELRDPSSNRLRIGTVRG